MANLLDYLVWRGEFPLSAGPWNAVDGLLAAVLSYLNFHGLQDHRGWTLQEAKRADQLIESPDNSFILRQEMFNRMADSVRFRDCRMHHSIAISDQEKHMQFSALCLDLPDDTVCVAFRGTDNTLVGWREDFDMAYQTRVPGQLAAAYYLEKVGATTDKPLRLAGHSKGGNLAVYAAANVSAALQDRIESIWSYDGPGMNHEISRSEGFLRIKEKIHSYIPQTSIIGLLMEYYKPYTVVRSTAKGMAQHDPMSWQVYGGRFEELANIDKTAGVVCETLHEWLENSTPQQRAAFVDALFQYANTTKATKMSELLNEKFRNLWTMFGNRKEIDPETRRVFNRLMGQAVSLGFGNVMDRVRGREDEEDESGNAWVTADSKQIAEWPETPPPVPPKEPAKKKRGRPAGKVEKQTKTDIDKRPDL